MYRHLPKIAFTLVPAFGLSLPLPAEAAEDAELQALRKQVELLSQQVQGLNALVEKQGALIASQQQNLQNQQLSVQAQARKWDETAAQVAAASSSAAAATPAPDQARITMAPGPRIESADGRYSLQTYGRVHMDATFFDDDNLDRANNLNLRRARMGFRGDLGEDFAYRIEADFASETADLRDVYLAYQGIDNVTLQAGNFKPPVGLEQNTSSNYIQTIERSSATNAFTRGHLLGAAAFAGGEGWTAAGGVYNEDTAVNNGADDEGFSLDARASANLLHGSPHVLHVGLGASARKPNEATDTVSIAARPAGTGPLNGVSTGAIANVERSYVFGPELAAVYGPLSLQGEYIRNHITRDGAPSAAFDGWYGQAAWMLTGESRPYKGGNFDRVKPREPLSLKDGGLGAVELVGRFDTIDLNDASAGIAGGRMDQWTAGVNWYMTDYVRLMLNLTAVNTDAAAVAPNDDPRVLNLRAQWDF